MNCCEQHQPYGCNQGPDCPVRAAQVAPVGQRRPTDPARVNAPAAAEAYPATLPAWFCADTSPQAQSRAWRRVGLLICLVSAAVSIGLVLGATVARGAL